MFREKTTEEIIELINKATKELENREEQEKNHSVSELEQALINWLYKVIVEDGIKSNLYVECLKIVFS